MLFSKIRTLDLPWPLLGVEALLIVLSVLLALALDNWRDEREHRELVHRAMQSFVDEMRYNCQRILVVADYHQAVLSGEQSPQGLQVGLLRNDAWEVVKTSGAAAWLDYDLIEQMSAISIRQGDHRAVMQAYLQAMFLLMLPQSDSSNWHQPGERGVINELHTIQDELQSRYLRLAEQFATAAPAAVQTELVCQRSVG
ncbi:MAG: hypothetical protein KKC01_04435 [Gammaproteobacteria bacterium]|nr:hypothetical protein [Gammaproteobacteria bacterium]